MIETTTHLQLNLDAVTRVLSQGVRRAFAAAGAKHVQSMAKSDRLKTRTGALRRSFGFEMRGDGLELEMRVFASGLPYIRAQEYGGTIKPKNKRYLTVPLPDALTPAGVIKGGARLVQAGNKYETADGAPTFIFRSKKGNLLIGSRARNGALKLLYTLKPSVTLKPRLGFRSTFDSVTMPFLEQQLKLEASKL